MPDQLAAALEIRVAEKPAGTALLKGLIMETRTIKKQVTFAKPFQLAGLEGFHPPGDYVLVLEQERLDALSFVGWRRTAATLQIGYGGTAQHVAVDLQNLTEALPLDSGQATNPPTAPATQMMRSGPRAHENLRARANH